MDIETLQQEIASLRRSGADTLQAYTQKKDQYEELMESLFDLQARYDSLAAAAAATSTNTTTSTTTTPPPSSSSLEMRVAELEAALQAKDELLRSLQASAGQKEEEIVALRTQLQAAAADAAAAAAQGGEGEEGQHHKSNNNNNNNTKDDEEAKHRQSMDVIEHAFELLESQQQQQQQQQETQPTPLPTPTATPAPTPPLSTSEETSFLSPNKHDLQQTIRTLLNDLALVRDFSGIELEVTKEALEEEGAERERALQGEMDGVKDELRKVQQLIDEVKAQAAEQATKDAQAIQELEVTVQLTEGALQMAKAQQEKIQQQAQTDIYAAANSIPLGGLSPTSTSRLQAAMDELKSKLNETERRAQEAEVGRDQLMQELERMEQSLIMAEENANAHAAAAAAAAATTAASASAVVEVEEKPTMTSVGTSMTPIKATTTTTATATTTPRTPTHPQTHTHTQTTTTPSVATAKKTCAELRRLKAELLQTKAQLDAAKTNTNLLQRYIAVRKIVSSPGLDPLLGLCGGKVGGDVGVNGGGGAAPSIPPLPAAAAATTPGRVHAQTHTHTELPPTQSPFGFKEIGTGAGAAAAAATATTRGATVLFPSSPLPSSSSSFLSSPMPPAAAGGGGGGGRLFSEEVNQ